MRWKTKINVEVEADSELQAKLILNRACRELNDYFTEKAHYDWPVPETREGIEQLERMLNDHE
jgi:hypothetical protein